MGGTDDPDNIIYLTIEEHAQAHKELFEKYGRWEDELAWKGLSGLITSEECSKERFRRAGQKGAKARIEKYSEEQRSEWARNAAKSNWEKNREKLTEVLRENSQKYGHLGGQPSGKYIWITNGKENLKVSKDDEIPEGWSEGRIKLWKTGYSTKKKDKVTCPHCGKSGGKPVMKRFHFDNCKHKGK